jgi:hypothetical protein
VVKLRVTSKESIPCRSERLDVPDSCDRDRSFGRFRVTSWGLRSVCGSLTYLQIYISKSCTILNRNATLPLPLDCTPCRPRTGFLSTHAGQSAPILYFLRKTTMNRQQNQFHPPSPLKRRREILACRQCGHEKTYCDGLPCANCGEEGVVCENKDCNHPSGAIDRGYVMYPDI